MSNSLIPITDEQAKLGQEILETFRGLGSFLEKALGSTPEDLVGYLGGDSLRVRRVENMARLLHEVEQRLKEMDIKETKPATLSVALPILEAGADEDRDDLVDLWARLFATAMDPVTRNSVRQSYIASIKQMDPTDARIMYYLYSGSVGRIRRGGGGNKKDTSFEFMSAELGFRQDDVEVSVEHLMSLGFLSTAVNDKNVWFPNAKLREFMRACYPELTT